MNKNDRPAAVVVEGCGKAVIRNVSVPSTCDGVRAKEVVDLKVSNIIVRPSEKQEFELKLLEKAIKKPSANNNKGWKIMIVGSILSLFIGAILVHYSEWNKERNQPLTQKEKTTQLKEK